MRQTGTARLAQCLARSERSDSRCAHDARIDFIHLGLSSGPQGHTCSHLPHRPHSCPSARPAQHCKLSL